MGIFKNFKHNSAVDRLNEERIYEIVINEIKSGKRREGIWGQALEKANGDLKKTEANYIKLRVQSLKDEFEIQKNIERDKQLKKDEIAKLKKSTKNSVTKTIIKKPKNKDEVSGKKFLTFILLFLLTLFVFIPLFFVILNYLFKSLQLY